MSGVLLSMSRGFGVVVIYVLIGVPLDMACVALHAPLWEQWFLAAALLLFSFRLDALLKSVEPTR